MDNVHIIRHLMVHQTSGGPDILWFTRPLVDQTSYGSPDILWFTRPLLVHKVTVGKQNLCRFTKAVLHQITRARFGPHVWNKVKDWGRDSLSLHADRGVRAGRPFLQVPAKQKQTQSESDEINVNQIKDSCQKINTFNCTGDNNLFFKVS